MEAKRSISGKALDEGKGLMEKKNPSLRGGYQKRFLKLFEGRYLCYFDPEKLLKPNGVIDLATVGSIDETKDGEQRANLIHRFVLPGPKRPCLFKPESEQERQRWVKALRMAAAEVQASLEIERPTQLGRSATTVLDKADDRVREGLAIMSSEDYHLSQQGVAAKGIQKAIKHELPERARTRMVYGFMDKKREGTVKIYQKRWFFIVCSRPLNKASYLRDDYDMPVMYIPGDMEFNTLYYYKLEKPTDDSKPRGSIPCKELCKVTTAEESGSYLVQVNIGERTYVMKSAYQSECQRWMEALEIAGRTARELAASKTHKSRNISKLIEAFTRGGKTGLEQLLAAKRDIWIPQGKQWTVPEELFEACTKVKDEFVILVDSVRCKEDLAATAKEELERAIQNTLHDKAMQTARTYWDTQGDKLQPIAILQFIDFWHGYDESLKLLDIEDENIHVLQDACASTFASSILTTTCGMVDNIVKRDLIEKGELVNDRGKYFTNAPSDIFKLFGPATDQVEKRRVDDLSIRVLEATREVLKYYARRASAILQDPKSALPKEHMIALLNDEDRFFDTMQRFLSNMVARLVKSENKKTAESAFAMRETTGLFREISSMVENKLTEEILNTLKPLAGPYATLDFAQVLDEAGEKGKDTAQHIALDTNFWVTFQHRLVTRYMQCFFTSTVKKSLKLEQVKEKPVQDKELYVQRFNETDAETFDDMKELIDGNFDNIPSICLRLRERFAEVLTMKNIGSLLKLRVDVEKKELEEMIKYCESKFGVMEEEEEDEEDEEEKEKGKQEEDKEAENEEDLDDPNFDLEAFLRDGGIDPTAAPQKSRSAVAEDVKLSADDIKVHLAKEISGYLDHKGKKRYFSVAGGKVMCYKTKSDTVTDPAFPVVLLKDVKTVTVQEGNKVVLKFADASQPVLEYIVPPSDDADKWAGCIKNNLPDAVSPTGKKKISAQLAKRGKGGVIKALPVPPMPFEIREPGAKKGKKKKKGKKGKKKAVATATKSAVQVQVTQVEPGRGCCWCCKKKTDPTTDYIKIN